MTDWFIITPFILLIAGVVFFMWGIVECIHPDFGGSPVKYWWVLFVISITSWIVGFIITLGAVQ